MNYDKQVFICQDDEDLDITTAIFATNNIVWHTSDKIENKADLIKQKSVPIAFFVEKKSIKYLHENFEKILEYIKKQGEEYTIVFPKDIVKKNNLKKLLLD